MNPEYSEIYAIAPQMNDYNNVIFVWKPYLMFTSQPGFSSPIVSTDSNGFRNSTWNGEVINTTNLKPGQKINIVAGGSTAFGVGAMGDQKTIPSVLSQISGNPWLNLGSRGYNSIQELLSFMLFVPDLEIENVILFSGVNDISTALMAGQVFDHLPPFYYQSKFLEYMNPQHQSRWRRTKDFIKELLGRSVDNKWQIPAGTFDYDIILGDLDRILKLWCALRDQKKFKLHYFFQPFVTYMNKPLHPKEKTTFELLDRMQGDIFRILSLDHKKYAEPWQRDVKSVCEKAQIPFYNLNNSPAYNTDEWLFVDRAHLTDRGYELTAQEIAKNLELPWIEKSPAKIDTANSPRALDRLDV